MTLASHIAAKGSASPHTATTADVTYSRVKVGTAAQPTIALATLPTRGRIASFDFIKGPLVLVMVLYHWLNYFVGLQWSGYRYLRFLTPSFIFITGFLVSYIYLAKYSYDDPRLRRRLVRRGGKLLLLFVLLNVVADRTLGIRIRL